MDEHKTEPVGQQPEAEVEDLELGEDESAQVAGGQKSIIKSGDPEDGGN